MMTLMVFVAIESNVYFGKQSSVSETTN